MASRMNRISSSVGCHGLFEQATCQGALNSERTAPPTSSQPPSAPSTTPRGRPPCPHAHETPARNPNHTDLRRHGDVCAAVGGACNRLVQPRQHEHDAAVLGLGHNHADCGVQAQRAEGEEGGEDRRGVGERPQ